jgi:hypothetical protein
MISRKPFGAGLRTGSNDWRKIVEDLKLAREEYSRHSSMMTPYERQVVSESIKEEVDKNRKWATQAALKEFQSTVEAFANAQIKIEKAKGQEVNRWEPGKLADEMRVASLLVDQALESPFPIDELRRIYSDANTSQDMFKKRGVAEVLKGAVNRVKSGDYELLSRVNSMSQMAARDLEQLRITPEIEKAHQEAGEAFENHMAVRKELNRAAEILGDTMGPISRALMRVKYDDTGPHIKINVTGDIITTRDETVESILEKYSGHVEKD